MQVENLTLLHYFYIQEIYNLSMQLLYLRAIEYIQKIYCY